MEVEEQEKEIDDEYQGPVPGEETEEKPKPKAKPKNRETAIAIPGKLRPASLILPPNLPFDQWVKAGETLGAIRGVTPWAIGDWLVYGEHNYGEKFSQAADITGLEPASLQVYQWVASRIDPQLRRQDISHAHHQVLAKLEPEDIAKWLDVVQAKNLSVAELRSAIREKRAKQARKAGDTENAPKYKVLIHFEDDPGEEFLGRLEAYVAKEGGEIKYRKW